MWRFVKLGLIGLLILGTIFNFTLKDSYYISGILFYALPLPILVLLSVLLTSLYRERRKLFVVFLMVTITLVSFWIHQSYMVTGPSGKGDMQVAFWNAAKHNNFEDAREILEEIETDILVMVEYDQTDKKSIRSIEADNPEYHFELIEGKIGIMSKFPFKIEAIRHYENYSLSVVFSIRTEDKKRLKVAAVDVGANPFHSRKQILDEALSEVKEHECDIVVGDFNTPLRSVFFSPYKQRFQHAFSAGGSGFVETWPYGIPLLSIDHFWISKEMKVTKVSKLNSLRSDHAMLVALLEF